ncbi:MAG: response regulator [Butyrivibrio sp.]|nr:response regulator [Acetatifactor muris]MCM1559315.1 response regulator [Butyrivibrio sp.]
MYKLLIADDEPLVQAGLKSMLNWSDLNIEICGTAMNGQTALKMIEEQNPDLCITDIKMPVMSGLELIRTCRERFGGDRPLFIILTSYEDFHMVKEALTYQVTDYLVKLELTPETLREAVNRVMERINRAAENATPPNSITYLFNEKFFIRLLNNLFESEEQFALQSHDLSLDFHYKAYVCCYGEMSGRQADALPAEKQISLFSSSIQILKELTGKYRFCYVLTLDIRHFALIFCYEEAPENLPDTWAGDLKGILESIRETLNNYYNVSFRCGIGIPAGVPLAVCDSYQCSRQAFQEGSGDCAVTCFEDCLPGLSGHNAFNISLFKEDLTKAFEEYDALLLQQTLDALCELLLTHPRHYLQALDAACNILFLSLSLLQNGEAIVSGFFRDNPDGYRSIYKQTTVEQAVNWLKFLEKQLCLLFEDHHKDYKNHIVTNVKKYINSHVSERLSLNETAAVFGISPNYLSQLFGKYNDLGFSEYINTCKINEAKRLLDDGSLKVYEVADKLGFESSFYFSKVFKKLEGISPSDYVNRAAGA